MNKVIIELHVEPSGHKVIDELRSMAFQFNEGNISEYDVLDYLKQMIHTDRIILWELNIKESRRLVSDGVEEGQ